MDPQVPFESKRASSQNIAPPCQVIDGCTIPTDLILQSSDGKSFGAHSQNLEWFADGFPLSGSITQSKVVPLPETTVTLSHFLKLSHNHPAPDLSALKIDELLALAEAADKYCNSFALSACRQPMLLLADQSSEDALKILRFKAIARDFVDIDRIAVKTLDLSIKRVHGVFGRTYAHEFTIWVLFQQSWKEFIDRYLEQLQAEAVDPQGVERERRQKRREQVRDQSGMKESPAERLYRFNHGVAGVTKNACFTINDRRVKPLRAAMATDTPSLDRFDMFSQAFCAIPNSACPSSCDAYRTWCERVRETLKTPPTWAECMSY